MQLKISWSQTISPFASAAGQGSAQQMSLSRSIHRRVHSEPTLDYSLFLEPSGTPRNGERWVALLSLYVLLHTKA